jgi:D-apionolactonase
MSGTEVSIALGQPARELLPPFGAVIGGNDAPNDHQLSLLEGLRVDHLRVDLDMSADWRMELERAARSALSLGAGLEIACLLGTDPGDELQGLADALPRAQAGVKRFLVLERDRPVSGTAVVQRAREMLRATAPSATFVCGTSRSFDVLEEDPPDAEGADAVVFSVLGEATPGRALSLADQGRKVRSALALLGKPVVVSPVVLQEQTAARIQWGLAGAAWTVASIKQLLEAGASSFTYFDALGSLGLVAASAEAGTTEDRQVSPAYHVLADLGDWRTTVLVPSTSSNPAAVETLIVRSERGVHALIVNLTEAPQRCTVPMPARNVALRALEHGSLSAALCEPRAYRGSGRTEECSEDGNLRLDLLPHSVVRVDPAPQR